MTRKSPLPKCIYRRAYTIPARLKPSGLTRFRRDLSNSYWARRECLAAPETRTGMDVAMVGNLAHHAIDHELVVAELGARHRRERVGHEGALGLGGGGAMLSEHRHRRVARVAIENRECHGMDEAGVMLGVLTQLAEFALGHDSRLNR